MLTITAIAGTNGSPGVMNTNVFLKKCVNRCYKPNVLTNENLLDFPNVRKMSLEK